MHRSFPRRRWAIPLIAGLLLTLTALAGCSSREPIPSGPRFSNPPSPLATRDGAWKPYPSAEAPAIPDAPRSDPFDLARRYRGTNASPLSQGQLYEEPLLGSNRNFWVLDSTAPSANEINATLRYIGRRALWYIDSRHGIDADKLERAARVFDEEIYPQVLSLVAPDLEIPGKIALVHTPMKGVAGYFSPRDALPEDVYPLSNQRAALFLHQNDNFGSSAYFGTLAHEFQHLVHWLIDPNEGTWLNEGLSEYAARALGFTPLPVSRFQATPNVSLVHWPTELGASLPNYTAASLFVQYLAERAGPATVHELVADRNTSLVGVERYLQSVGQPELDALFGDWMVTNALNQGSYRYEDVTGRAKVDLTIRGEQTIQGRVHQYGAWYARVEPGPNPLSLTFSGAVTTPLIATTPPSGVTCWWSNSGDGINSTLTRAFDLPPRSSATLKFRGWYDIEEAWDHAYVSASNNGGRTWTALATSNTTSDDPVKTALGPSFTGRSTGWQTEQADLSRFAGQRVLVRFEYVTDDSISAPGWCVDDIEVPELGFMDNVEGPVLWEVDGFVAATRAGVEQRYIVRVIRSPEGEPIVESPTLIDGTDASFVVTEASIVAIMAIAPKTSEPANFTIVTTQR